MGELIASGSGASQGKDGVDVIETDGSNCMNLPIEALEMDAPIRVLQTRLRADSGGAGTYRGGLGITREYEILGGDVSFTHRGERHTHPAQGARGGLPGATAQSIITRANGSVEEVPSKQVTVLHGGDRVLVHTAGGGGFGPYAARDRERVQTDLQNGKVSRDIDSP